MSNKENVTEQQEKVMTKYDLKKQKREEEKANKKKEQRKEKLVWAVVLIALVCFIAYFPIRSYMVVNEVFVRVNGEDISRVEFDYNYNVAKNNYISQWGSYLSLFGLDTTSDFSQQMYSETLTWEDYFEQETMNGIVRGKAMKAEAEAAGFTYDTKEDYKLFEQNIKELASQAGLSTKDYVRQAYGDYATLGRLENIVKESIWVNAYYTQLSEEMAPTDEEIQEYYEVDKNSFDSVDYYLTTVEAELPTEPTELADPVEEDAEADEAETAYVPSDAEIEKAMADAKVLADEAEATVATDGELQENAKYYDTNSKIRDWLYDETRKEGDTTVVEDTVGNRYYVLSFVKRYLDETPSANVRIIAAPAEDGQAILDEWKSGEATETSFGALADEKNQGTSFTNEGGLYEGIFRSGTLAAIDAWLFEEERAVGDTTVVTDESATTSYVLYYVGQNVPEWKLTAESEILTLVMENHLAEITKDAVIDDFKGNLDYIEILAAQEATAEGDAETESSETE